MANTLRNDLSIYDNVAHAWWSDDVRWIRTLKNLVPGRLSWFDRHVTWQDARVLDLGCAGGFMAEAIARKGALVTGIDPAKKAIEAARAHAQEKGIKIQYDVGAGELLPYDDDAFDIIVCVDVLEHVANFPTVLAEIARVLRPGGTFLYDTIHRNLISRLVTVTFAEDILGLLPKGTHDPDMFIKPSELIDVMHQVGLRAGKMTGLGPNGINRRGDFVFGALPLRTVIYMGVAYKDA
ncbi:bifunctional 2-polyprenyl-6-hydroxyphenol methylase/3-demethylubiquinol 3-O-methyltransferase UbiG [Rhodospirillales bacterium]|nr:bifunctional 2-polyprenyl-6-hydroxyphenol methylase/3-demethylubiquinol 3-O-methyltransferase UbiG [Rhodospirillales bacterium]